MREEVEEENAKLLDEQLLEGTTEKLPRTTEDEQHEKLPRTTEDEQLLEGTPLQQQVETKQGGIEDKQTNMLDILEAR